MSRRVRRFLSFALGAVVVAQAACGGLTSKRGTTGTNGARPAPHFEPGFNIFTPEQDVELGRRSAEQVARQVPLMNDAQTVNYVRALGAKLAAHAPGQKFQYQFNVVGTRDINAFALPGGFVFVNAGAILAAKDEGELAGVIAHEITHVALRHGTNQASKAYIAQKGLGMLGRVFGRDNDLGQLIGAVGGTGANMLFLRFGRAAETQADLEGARIMADAGYDPREMANFFKTLQAKGGQRTPEFLSDHPDPGNRVASINQVLPSLHVSDKPLRDTREFEEVKARLGGRGGRESIASEAEPQRTGPSDTTGAPREGARPPRPSAAFRQYQSDDGSFALQYPDNWDALVADDANMIFAPKGAYGEMNRSLMVTHGIFIGAVAPKARDLPSASAAFVRDQLGANPDFRVQENPRAISFGGREAYATVVAGPSAVTGVTEIDVIYTTATADGRLFYLITMAPEDEFPSYQATFKQIIESVRLAR